ncbi:MAG: helix-turn-helix transcriptional regulator [Anaerolineae bacterium]|nr:helix-turn-helix transcriptional regulator [Anaerolineae bacterium]
MNDPTPNLISELRRGALALSVLSQLREPTYGYALKEKLAGGGLEIDQGTLYPLLRRLEEQGLLQSEWSLNESRPRRYYRLNETGQTVLATLTREWQSLISAMQRLLHEEGA